MRLDFSENPTTLDRTYTLTLSRADLADARYIWLDSRMLEECENSDSVADKLLALQTIVYRIEQERKRKDGLQMAWKRRAANRREADSP